MVEQLPSPVSLSAPTGNQQLSAWAPAVLRGLNKFIQQTVTALKAVAQSGPAYKAISVSTDEDGDVLQLPLIFDNPLNRQPMDVHLAFISSTGVDVQTGAVTAFWNITSTGQIRIYGLTGLSPSVSYDMNLSVS